jgi:hypothetical protein
MEAGKPEIEEPPDNWGKSMRELELEKENKDLTARLQDALFRLQDALESDDGDEPEQRNRSL